MEGSRIPVCQACDKPGKNRCSACGCGYYCSAKCQKTDYESHKRTVCSLWQGQADVVHNPWFAPVSPQTLASVLNENDDDLFVAARTGDEAMLEACIKRGAKLSAARGPHGESSLHYAVLSGSSKTVARLLRAGAYINVMDWRGANPLYYACTHPDVGDDAERLAMVKYLVSQGADTMQLSNFSGKRPFQAAKNSDIAEAIETHPFHLQFCADLKRINEPRPPLRVRQIVDLRWRASTAGWLIQPNRDGTFQCFQPQPECVVRYRCDLDGVERLFKDCQARHRVWLAYHK